MKFSGRSELKLELSRDFLRTGEATVFRSINEDRVVSSDHFCSTTVVELSQFKKMHFPDFASTFCPLIK